MSIKVQVLLLEPRANDVHLVLRLLESDPGFNLATALANRPAALAQFV